jgi:hypothetical protein
VHFLLLYIAYFILYIFSAHLKVGDKLGISSVFYFDFLQNMYGTFLVLFWRALCVLYEISTLSAEFFWGFVYYAAERFISKIIVYPDHSHYSNGCYRLVTLSRGPHVNVPVTIEKVRQYIFWIRTTRISLYKICRKLSTSFGIMYSQNAERPFFF